MQPAAFLQLQAVGGLGHQHHVAAQRAGFHFAGQLGLQGAGAAIEEEGAVVARGQVGEFGLQGFVHHIDDELVHGGVDHNGAGHVLVHGQRGGSDAQEHGDAQYQRDDFLHETGSSFNFVKFYFYIGVPM